MEFSLNNKLLVSQATDREIKIWSIENAKELQTIKNSPLSDFTFIDFGSNDKLIGIGFDTLWDVANVEKFLTIDGLNRSTDIITGKFISFDPNSSYLVVKFEQNVYIFILKELIKTIEIGNATLSFSFNSATKLLALGGFNNGQESIKLKGTNKHMEGVIDIWDIVTGQKVFSFTNNSLMVSFVQFNHDGSILAVGSWDKLESLPDYSKSVYQDNEVLGVVFPPIHIDYCRYSVRFWDVKKRQEIKYDQLPDWVQVNEHPSFFAGDVYSISTLNGKLIQAKWKGGIIELSNPTTKDEIASLIALTNDDWIVVTPDGRFDTNIYLDKSQGLHWNLSNDPLKAFPIEIFMRQYYEPNLLQRVLKCNEENNCDTEFKPLPSIADINRVQPKVAIKEINLVKNADGLADVTVEVESVTEDVSISATDRTKKEKLISKAFDLRLFRDGQLVGVSTPKDKLEPFIKSAPDLIEKNKAYFKKTGKLTNTPEDVAWREANDIFALVERENVKRISPDKFEYTFRNVKLPKDQDEQ